MAKYTNKAKIEVEVSQEHIETAVRIKLELQNTSPSGKCNWKRHKELMEQAGFYDSENSETYRQLIKIKQKEMGLLPSNKKYAEFLADKKIESIEKLVGDMYIANRERQNINRQLNKTKREIADESLVIKDIKENITNLDVIKFEKHQEVKDIENAEFVGLVTPADWHIGMLFNDLNFEVATQRVGYYAERVIQLSKTFGIKKVYVTHLGDIINHVYMHKNTQAYHSEFNVSEQIVKGTQLMFSFLNKLATELHVVYMGTIVGNHGRMSAKGETLTDDNVEVVIHEMIKTMIDMAQSPNLTVDDSGYSKSFLVQPQVVTKNIGYIHGDKESRTGADRIKKYSSILGTQLDLLIQGHTHNYKVESENYDRKIITSGSLMGSDDYAQGLGLYTNASQLFVAVSNKEVIPIDINLDNIR